jgi:hypothetical protein
MCYLCAVDVQVMYIKHITIINKLKQTNKQMTTNLLAIESNFLANAEIKSALKLNDIKRLQTNLTNAQKRKFEQSIELSKIVVEATDFFKSDSGKQKFAEHGISWSMEDFALKVFGWQTSYFCKVRKVGTLEDTIINNFREQCDTIERDGKESDRSIAALLKFAKQDTTEGEGEGEAAEKLQTIFVLTYKQENSNTSIKVDSKGNVKTTNTKAEILAAIQYLQSLLPNE